MSPTLPVSGWLLASLAGAAAAISATALMGRVPLRYNLRNLIVRWKTTGVTALAFMLVLAPMTIMFGLVDSMNRIVAASGRPGNVLVLADGSTDETHSYLGATDVDALPLNSELQPLLLRDEAGRCLYSREVYVVVNQPLQVGASHGQTERRFVQLRGVEDPEVAAVVHGLELMPGGRWFIPSGVQDLTIEAVLGEAVAREFGYELQGRPLRVGDRFSVGAREWIAVGILQGAGTTFSSEIWAKASLVREFGKEDLYSSMVLCTRNSDTAQAATQILRAFRQSPLWALPETEYYHELSDTNRQFLAIIVFITVVMAIGGILSVMNTMFAAIAQRTQDIAMLRVLGFARWQILLSFLLESLAIGLVGGSLGCALGYLANGWTVTAMMGSILAGGTVLVVELHVDANTLALGVLLSLAMAVLGGLLPSLSAVRLRPLEAFR